MQKLLKWVICLVLFFGISECFDALLSWMNIDIVVLQRALYLVSAVISIKLSTFLTEEDE
jgi:hypothetical protein